LPATAATTAKHPINILYGESDETVLTNQSVAMKKAGHTVTAAVGRRGVQDALQNGSFDLVILGATLTRDDRHHLPYMVRKASKTARVLVMQGASRHHEVDAAIDPNMSMPLFLEKIARLMAEPKARV
jgi:DNA-binding NtrC family response regulator